MQFVKVPPDRVAAVPELLFVRETPPPVPAPLTVTSTPSTVPVMELLTEQPVKVTSVSVVTFAELRRPPPVLTAVQFVKVQSVTRAVEAPVLLAFP